MCVQGGFVGRDLNGLKWLPFRADVTLLVYIPEAISGKWILICVNLSYAIVDGIVAQPLGKNPYR